MSDATCSVCGGAPENLHLGPGAFDGDPVFRCNRCLGREPAAPPLAPADVQAIRARADAATIGPWWTAQTNEDAECCDNCRSDCCWHILSPHKDYPDIAVGSNWDSGVERFEDASFIAASRTDVPALCDALEAAWRESAALRLALETPHDSGCEREGRRCSCTWPQRTMGLIAGPGRNWGAVLLQGLRDNDCQQIDRLRAERSALHSALLDIQSTAQNARCKMSNRSLIHELRHAADSVYGSASYWTGHGMAAILTRAADRLEVLEAGIRAYRENWRASNHSVEGCTEHCPDECTDESWADATDRVLEWERGHGKKVDHA